MQSIDQVEGQALVAETLPPQGSSCLCSDKTKKAIKDIVVGAGISGVGIAFMAVSPPGSLLQLTGSDVVVSATKTNILKKVPYVNAVLFSVPALSALTGISYFVDPTKISTAIFGGLLAKETSRVFKNLMKGQPIKEAFTEGLPENLQKRLVCGKTEATQVAEVEAEDDDDDDDREWEPPSLTRQAALVGGIAAGAITAYLMPQFVAGATTTIATVYLMNTLAKVVTVGLRQLPIIPGAAIGALAATAGAVTDFAVPTALPIKIFPPLSLFGWQVASDSIQMYLKGKIDKRNWIACASKEKAEDTSKLKAEKADATLEAVEIEKPEKKEKKPKEKKKDTGPSLAGRALTVGLAGAATIGANIVQPDGGLLPQAMSGSFSQVFTKGVIGKPPKDDKSPEVTIDRLKLVGARSLFYGTVMAAAYGTDRIVQLVAPGSPLSFTSVATSFTLKMTTSKEIKEVTNLNYTQEVGTSMKESLSSGVKKVTSSVGGAFSSLWQRIRGGEATQYSSVEETIPESVV